MVVAYQLIDSQIQLEFLKSDEPFSRTFAPIASFAKKKTATMMSAWVGSCPERPIRALYFFIIVFFPRFENKETIFFRILLYPRTTPLRG